MDPVSMISFKAILSAIIFSLIGIIALGVSFVVFDRITPGHLWKEVVENKNVALAITAGAMIMGMAQIIAAAIHG